MTHVQMLQKSYPNAFIAVVYTEAIICGNGDPEAGEEGSGWDLMMSTTPPMSPDDVISCIRTAMEGETDCRAEEALAQTYHPEYVKYLQAKLGLL